MSHAHGRETPAKSNAEEPAEKTRMQEEEHGLEAVKPPLTGMIGMHIDQQGDDAASGSPGADIDRNLVEEK